MAVEVSSELTILDKIKTERLGNEPPLAVKSHWSKSDIVILCIGGELELHVFAADLHKAIRKATG